MPLVWKFQQESDPKHCFKAVKDWFQEECPSGLVNPLISIELRTFRVNSENIAKAWYNIPLKICRKLITSMPRRIDAVLKNNGGTAIKTLCNLYLFHCPTAI